MIRERLVSILTSVMFIFGIFCAIDPVMGQEEHPFDGNVFDENEHSGIDGARIEFHSDEDPWVMDDVTTDYNGYYSIYLEPGNYSIIVSAEGYDTRTYDRFYVGEGSNEDFYLSPQSYDDDGGSDGYDGDGGSDGDGDGSDGDDGDSENNMESFLPAGVGDNINLLAGVCFIVFILFIVSFLIIACAALGIFVRLGKIKRDVNKLTEGQSSYRYEEPYPPRPQRPRHSERDLPPPPPPPPPR